MPAVFRIRLRPPSHPTRNAARSAWPSESSTSTPEPRHLAFAGDRHPKLTDPGGQHALDVLLPQSEAVVVAGGEVADVQPGPGEALDLHRLPRREEPIGDPALVEHLDRARVQATRARAGEVLARAPFDHDDVDPGQCQLARQHQPRRAASGDRHRMLPHSRPPRPIGRQQYLRGADSPGRAQAARLRA
jgi:hypothetical protein